MKKTNCIVDGCMNEGTHAKGYCNKHYLQMYRHGRILKTIYDRNTINIKGRVCEIICLNKNQTESSRAIFDLEYYELVRKHKWCIHNSGYACTTLKDHSALFLHQLILKPQKGFITDHINHNKLDNRLINLRRATTSLNARNTLLSKNNNTGCVGIWRDEERNRYQAYIYCNKTYIHLGRFQSYDEAVLARKNAELKYFGEIINRELSSI